MGIGAMPHRRDGDGFFALIDQVAEPIGAAPRAVGRREQWRERLADAIGVVDQGTVDELDNAAAILSGTDVRSARAAGPAISNR